MKNQFNTEYKSSNEFRENNSSKFLKILTLKKEAKK